MFPISMVRRKAVFSPTLNAWQVIDDDRTALLECMFAMWGIAYGDRFPGATCVSIERKDFADLQMHQYWVCEKTDGVRYLMMCTRYKDLNIIALINRNLEVFLLGINIARTLYDGTILDGEIATNKTTGQTEFLIFDAISVAGESVRDMRFGERMTRVADALREAPQPSTDLVTIRGKTFFSMADFENFEVHRERIKESYDLDGLIFTPEELPVWTFRHRKMFKWKDHHTIDFLVAPDAKGELALHLYDSLNKKMKKAAVLRTTTSADGAVLKANDVVECVVNKSKWDPLFVRVDKSHPNDMETYRRTLINIRENISVAEFKDLVKAQQQ